MQDGIQKDSEYLQRRGLQGLSHKLAGRCGKGDWCDAAVAPVAAQMMSQWGSCYKGQQQQRHHTVALAVGGRGSHLLQAMARLIFLTLAVLGIALKPWLVNDPLDRDDCERMQQYTEQLIEGMARLVQEMEEKNQQQSWVALGALLFTALKQWQFWALVELLVLVFGLCRWLRKRSCEPGSSNSEHGTSTREEENNNDSDDTDEDGDSDDSWDLGRVWADSTQWPAPHMADKCKMVEELVEELLGACRRLSGNCLFNPRLQLAIGMGCLYEGWCAWKTTSCTTCSCP